MLAVGESRAIAFRVVTPGTYCYWGSGQIIGRTAVARRLRLFVTERPSSDTVAARFSYVLQERSAPPSPDSARRPGATLELRVREPTEIVVINLARHATAVHWHGLELDSYFDGVAGRGE